MSVKVLANVSRELSLLFSSVMLLLLVLCKKIEYIPLIWRVGSEQEKCVSGHQMPITSLYLSFPFPSKFSFSTFLYLLFFPNARNIIVRRRRLLFGILRRVCLVNQFIIGLRTLTQFKVCFSVELFGFFLTWLNPFFACFFYSAALFVIRWWFDITDIGVVDPMSGYKFSRHVSMLYTLDSFYWGCFTQTFIH